jgi:hypothetical protein
VVLVETLKPEVEENGLTKTAIQTDVELKLRQAGIPVLDAKDPKLPKLEVAALEINVNIVTSSDGIWVFTVSVALGQNVRLVRDPSIIGVFANTWDVVETGRVGKPNVRELRDLIKDGVDTFINAYLSVNPKK